MSPPAPSLTMAPVTLGLVEVNEITEGDPKSGPRRVGVEKRETLRYLPDNQTFNNNTRTTQAQPITSTCAKVTYHWTRNSTTGEHCMLFFSFPSFLRKLTIEIHIS